MTARNHHAVSPTLGAAILCASIVAAIASSCWHPTFDPMLSASELTVKKLGEPTMYFTIPDANQYGMDQAWFLPPMMDLPNTGLLVLDMDSHIGFKSVSSIDPLNHTGWINNTVGFEMQNSMGDAYLVQAAPDGGTNALLSTNISGAQIVQMFDLSNPAIVLPGTNTQGSFGIGSVANIALTATLACYSYDALSLEPEYAVRTAWSGGTPAPVFTIDPGTILTFSSAPQVTVPGRFFYSFSSTNYYYLSCGMSDGSRAIYRWTLPGAEPTRFPENYGPLIGALSDGRLLAERDGIISVLDQNLNRLFKFPAGALRFVHERYDSTDVPPSMKVVFTRTMFVRESNHDDQGTVRAEVYEIPTANLADLAE